MDNFRIIQRGDNGYPSLLEETFQPPEQLYVQGSNIDFTDRLAVAVVGSRRASSYGAAATKRLVDGLARAGVIIVSGLAYGIDRLAHEATLAAGGTTIAVLGTPIDKIYPADHTYLAHQIISHRGQIVSEYAPGTKTHKGSFPERNRIIAGMSQATIVVEAAVRSGSLITARLALEENREVFAVPGPITSAVSEGTNQLLRAGARPAVDASDILEAFGRSSSLTTLTTNTTHSGGDEDDPLLCAIPANEPVHVDNLLKSVTIDLPELQKRLIDFELAGQIKMTQPGWYIRT